MAVTGQQETPEPLTGSPEYVGVSKRPESGGRSSPRGLHELLESLVADQ